MSRQRTIFLYICISFFVFLPFFASAASLSELRAQIDQRTQEIKRLEEEAKKFRQEIAQKQEKGKTLKGEITRLDRTIGQVQRDLSLTQKKIGRAQLEIQHLNLEIDGKESSMKTLTHGLAALVKTLNEKEGHSLLETLVQYKTLSVFFQQIDYSEELNKKILSSLDTLRQLKRELEVKNAEAKEKKEEAEDLKQELGARKTTLNTEKGARSTLLTVTKNEEKKYQELLRDREAKIDALEAELREIERQFQVSIDISRLPGKGSGVLGWPLEEVALRTCGSLKNDATNCITQYFGYTAFARAGGYGGRQGHNGMDFRASVGTRVYGAESGEVAGTGDTDLGCRGASYGKWILLKHSNGLSTLYSHLSSISVSPGQSVRRGQLIGLSGQSGYATGPHLHFGAMISQATEIKIITSRICGRAMTLPVVGNDPSSGINGYLNTLEYL